MTLPVTRSLIERGDVRIELLMQGKGPLVVMIPSLGRGVPAATLLKLSRSKPMKATPVTRPSAFFTGYPKLTACRPVTRPIW